MKKNKTYRDQKIGTINKGFSYPEGQVVLFSEEYSPSGEYKGKVTIDIPMLRKEIKKQREEDSLITTMGTMVGVPSEYVKKSFFNLFSFLI